MICRNTNSSNIENEPANNRQIEQVSLNHRRVAALPDLPDESIHETPLELDDTEEESGTSTVSSSIIWDLRQLFDLDFLPRDVSPFPRGDSADIPDEILRTVSPLYGDGCPDENNLNAFGQANRSDNRSLGVEISNDFLFRSIDKTKDKTLNQTVLKSSIQQKLFSQNSKENIQKDYNRLGSLHHKRRSSDYKWDYLRSNGNRHCKDDNFCGKESQIVNIPFSNSFSLQDSNQNQSNSNILNEILRVVSPLYGDGCLDENNLHTLTEANGSYHRLEEVERSKDILFGSVDKSKDEEDFQNTYNSSDYRCNYQKPIRSRHSNLDYSLSESSSTHSACSNRKSKTHHSYYLRSCSYNRSLNGKNNQLGGLKISNDFRFRSVFKSKDKTLKQTVSKSSNQQKLSSHSSKENIPLHQKRNSSDYKRNYRIPIGNRHFKYDYSSNNESLTVYLHPFNNTSLQDSNQNHCNSDILNEILRTLSPLYGDGYPDENNLNALTKANGSYNQTVSKSLNSRTLFSDKKEENIIKDYNRLTLLHQNGNSSDFKSYYRRPIRNIHIKKRHLKHDSSSFSDFSSLHSCSNRKCKGHHRCYPRLRYYHKHFCPQLQIVHLSPINNNTSSRDLNQNQNQCNSDIMGNFPLICANSCREENSLNKLTQTNGNNNQLEGVDIWRDFRFGCVSKAKDRTLNRTVFKSLYQQTLSFEFYNHLGALPQNGNSSEYKRNFRSPIRRRHSKHDSSSLRVVSSSNSSFSNRNRNTHHFCYLPPFTNITSSRDSNQNQCNSNANCDTPKDVLRIVSSTYGCFDESNLNMFKQTNQNNKVGEVKRSNVCLKNLTRAIHDSDQVKDILFGTVVKSKDKTVNQTASESSNRQTLSSDKNEEDLQNDYNRLGSLQKNGNSSDYKRNYRRPIRNIRNRNRRSKYDYSSSSESSSSSSSSSSSDSSCSCSNRKRKTHHRCHPRPCHYNRSFCQHQCCPVQPQTVNLPPINNNTPSQESNQNQCNSNTNPLVPFQNYLIPNSSWPVVYIPPMEYCDPYVQPFASTPFLATGSHNLPSSLDMTDLIERIHRLDMSINSLTKEDCHCQANLYQPVSSYHNDYFVHR